MSVIDEIQAELKKVAEKHIEDLKNVLHASCLLNSLSREYLTKEIAKKDQIIEALQKTIEIRCNENKK